MSYDSDFVSWTRDQAKLLRALYPERTGLDIANLAEEIDALGRMEVSAMSQHLYRLLKSLLLLSATVDVPDRRRWKREASESQIDAIIGMSPGLDRHIDLARTYKLARRGAVDMLAELNVQIPDFPTTCPLAFDQLIDEHFDVAAAIKMLEHKDE
ncbi:hypothetical protein CO665_30600 [Rhizobium anhuiense]|uniref:DUF29 family protein n=1 Tax=Rhizobium anhuiense TaxID=1184720 RepID=UPI000BE903DC|nr:DUF29 family protein [Rhizobium anhuiense]PDS34386.1 hypothetical protein CO665_30600 [Rhizobium anhuiense]